MRRPAIGVSGLQAGGDDRDCIRVIHLHFIQRDRLTSPSGITKIKEVDRAPSSPFAAQHRPAGRKIVLIRSEGQLVDDATFAAFTALAVAVEKLSLIHI